MSELCFKLYIKLKPDHSLLLMQIDKRRKIADQLINQLDEQLVECKEEMKRLQHSSADQEAVIAHAKILLGHKKM